MSDGFFCTSMVFTYNNPEESGEELLELFAAYDPKYCVFQLEEGEQKTPHFQGFVHFRKQRRIGPKFRKNFKGTIWCKKNTRGTDEQNRAYCTKQEGRLAGPWEIGEVSAGQGARTDLHAFVNAVVSGRSTRELIADFVEVLAKYPRFYATVVSMHMPALRPDGVRVVLSFGRTGVGKTREVVCAHAGSPDFFRQPLTTGFWMDGYDRHDVVLLDDFAGAASHITLTHCLQLLDRYPVQVPVKGSFVWWYPKEIHITTNIHPRLWYKWENREEQYAALMRRFTTIKEDLVELDALKRAQFEAWRPPVSDDVWNQ